MAKVSVKGTTAPSKKVKKTRPVFAGGEKNTDGEYTSAMPKDFDFSKFKPLKSKLFANKALHLEHLALYHEYKAVQLRERIKNPDLAKAKRIDKQMDKMLEFVEEMKKNGIDTSKYEAVVAAAKAIQAEVA